MNASYSTDFQAYLRSVCTDYKCWWSLYTFTDAVEQLPPLFDFGSTVRMVQRSQLETGKVLEKTERLPVLAELRKYALEQLEHVLLVGRPGSGKSTALARLLLEEAEQAIEDQQAKIPVLVELRQYKTSVLEDLSCCPISLNDCWKRQQATSIFSMILLT